MRVAVLQATNQDLVEQIDGGGADARAGHGIRTVPEIHA